MAQGLGEGLVKRRWRSYELKQIKSCKERSRKRENMKNMRS